MSTVGSRYISTFANYLQNFIERHQLIPTSGRLLLAVSAGADSICLLDLMGRLRLVKQIEVIHINHGTRPGNDQEEQLVREYCQRLGLKCHVRRLDLSGIVANFEMVARKERYQIFKNLLRSGDLLYTAHHLDDSYEWALLQQFKSSRDHLGIPLINGAIARPFLCLSRGHIRQYLAYRGLDFCEDPSNQDLAFERNYLRHNVIPKIASRFPSYLKHYVYRSNQRAFEMGKHRLSGQRGKDFVASLGPFGGIVITSTGGKGFEGAADFITEQIVKLSQAERGTLASQVEKLIQMAGPGFKGPLLFSGQVLGFSAAHRLYLVPKGRLGDWERLDRYLSNHFETAVASHIPCAHFERPEEHLAQEIFPYIAFFPRGDFPCLNQAHPLLPQTCRAALDRGLGYNSLCKVLDLNKRKKIPSEISILTHSGLIDYLK